MVQGADIFEDDFKGEQEDLAPSDEIPELEPTEIALVRRPWGLWRQAQRPSFKQSDHPSECSLHTWSRPGKVSDPGNSALVHGTLLVTTQNNIPDGAGGCDGGSGGFRRYNWTPHLRKPSLSPHSTSNLLTPYLTSTST